MELRHYITFAVIFVLLQFFLWIFNRTLRWLFAEKLGKTIYLGISFFNFILVNSIILTTFLRIFPNFRLSAFILLSLLYVAYTSLIVGVIFGVLKSRINREKLHRGLRLIYPVILAGFFGLSLYNAYVPKITYYSIQLDKPLKPLRIGVASDLHLGKLFGGKQLDQLAEIFEQQKVDLILMPGDIMDDNVDAYLAEKMQPYFAKLKAPLGVYATLGNHDLFGDEWRIMQEIKKAGVVQLNNQAVQINDEFVVVGRNDELDRNRPETAQLLQNVESHLPIFLMDHRPSEILIHANLPIDLQVSGHTHKGQVFPANLITALMYPLDYGYQKINQGHFVVTSGYGFWGIPARLGTQSEVVIIDVKGK